MPPPAASELLGTPAPPAPLRLGPRAPSAAPSAARIFDQARQWAAAAQLAALRDRAPPDAPPNVPTAVLASAVDDWCADHNEVFAAKDFYTDSSGLSG